MDCRADAMFEATDALVANAPVAALPHRSLVLSIAEAGAASTPAWCTAGSTPTRAAAHAAITAANITQLQVAWRVPIAATSAYGGMSATPLIVGDTVYVQEMQSNVFALARADGTLR
jgi:glucose dehydrogenase